MKIFLTSPEEKRVTCVLAHEALSESTINIDDASDPLEVLAGAGHPRPPDRHPPDGGA